MSMVKRCDKCLKLIETQPSIALTCGSTFYTYHFHNECWEKMLSCCGGE